MNNSYDQASQVVNDCNAQNYGQANYYNAAGNCGLQQNLPIYMGNDRSMESASQIPVASIGTQGNVTQSPVFNSYSGQPFTSEVAERMGVETYIRSMEAGFQHQILEHKAYNDSALEEQKRQNRESSLKLEYELKMKRDEGFAKRRDAIEGRNELICEDSNGFLRLMYEYEDDAGRNMKTGPIFGVPDIKIVEYISYQKVTDNFCVVECEDKKILLADKDHNAKGLFRKLKDAGIPINKGRDKIRQIQDMVYGYLMKHAKRVYLSEYTGWNKLEKGWLFVDSFYETMEGVKQSWKQKEY